MNGAIDRIEAVDTTFSDLDFGRTRAVTFAHNTFHGVDEPCYNPAPLSKEQATPSQTWQFDAAPLLPFGGRARFVDAVVFDGAIQDNSNDPVFEMPHITDNQGANGTETRFTFGTAVKGKVRYQVRMDNPL